MHTMTKPTLTDVDTEQIGRFLPAIFSGYKLRWLGTHGASHWARVIFTGLILSGLTGADRDVLVMFGLFHDSRRINDLHDPPHGERGGKLAQEMLLEDADWPQEKTSLLVEACNKHTAVRHHDNVTIQTCWDADRLDLPRIGATVDCDYLGPWATSHPAIVEAGSIRAREKQFPFADVFKESRLVSKDVLT
jgi:uncharacterized protein